MVSSQFLVSVGETCSALALAAECSQDSALRRYGKPGSFSQSSRFSFPAVCRPAARRTETTEAVKRERMTPAARRPLVSTVGGMDGALMVGESSGLEERKKSKVRGEQSGEGIKTFELIWRCKKWLDTRHFYFERETLGSEFGGGVLDKEMETLMLLCRHGRD